jgi:PA-IL-like protein
VRLRQVVALAGMVAGLTASLSADTLILRDGRRVQGELIAVRDGVVEFEGQKGFFGHERMRIDRDEVARIELDESRSTSSSGRDHNEYGGRPSGLREREVNVSATEHWTDTGVTVRAGQTIYVSASGKVRWGPGRQDGPAGEHNSPRNDARPIPSRPAASLIGRIGDADNYFFIGDDSDAIRVRDNGRLYLGINDDYLQDNSGAFRVTVYY